MESRTAKKRCAQHAKYGRFLAKNRQIQKIFRILLGIDKANRNTHLIQKSAHLKRKANYKAPVFTKKVKVFYHIDYFYRRSPTAPVFTKTSFSASR